MKAGRETSWVILLYGVRNRTVLQTFLPGKRARLSFSTSIYFVLFLRLTREQMKVTDHKKGTRDFSVQPLCFLSLKCCTFLFYFRIRFTELAQDGNQLAEHSMKTIPKGLQGPMLHPGKCQKSLEQWPRAAAVDFCHLNFSL